jgi:hypothetical protein
VAIMLATPPPREGPLRVNRVERRRSEGFPVCPRKLHCRPRRVGDERRRDFRAPSRRSHTGDAGARSRGRRWVMHSRRRKSLYCAIRATCGWHTAREGGPRERRNPAIGRIDDPVWMDDRIPQHRFLRQPLPDENLSARFPATAAGDHIHHRPPGRFGQAVFANLAAALNVTPHVATVPDGRAIARRHW